MGTEQTTLRKIGRDGAISILFYLVPVILLCLWLWCTGERPWIDHPSQTQLAWHSLAFLHLPAPVIQFLRAHWLTFFVLVIALFEIVFGLYGEHWSQNERIIDVMAYVAIQALIVPLAALGTFKLCSLLMPHHANAFGWVPFWWAVLILAVADDLTQYWYHRLHHQLPWMWRFHRTHHSARYMGVGIAYRQSIAYAIGFSNVYLIAALTFLGLGPAALVVAAIKSVIVVLSHSAILWDKPLYSIRWLHPITWLIERTFVLPATHHAHHAVTNDDGIGNYKGNFGNMFFWWDLSFGTAHISRQYPSRYGVSHYEDDPWQAQMFWPIIKSPVEGSELSKDGPVIRGDVPLLARHTPVPRRPLSK